MLFAFLMAIVSAVSIKGKDVVADIPWSNEDEEYQTACVHEEYQTVCVLLLVDVVA